MNLERDKYLTEAMGECWHESQGVVSWRCNKCNFVGLLEDWVDEDCNNDFSTWDGFGLLFTWAQEQKWYAKFVFNRLRSGYACYPTSRMNIPDRFIHPDHFADAIYEYLKERR